MKARADGGHGAHAFGSRVSGSHAACFWSKRASVSNDIEKENRGARCCKLVELVVHGAHVTGGDVAAPTRGEDIRRLDPRSMRSHAQDLVAVHKKFDRLQDVSVERIVCEVSTSTGEVERCL